MSLYLRVNAAPDDSVDTAPRNCTPHLQLRTPNALYLHHLRHTLFRLRILAQPPPLHHPHRTILPRAQVLSQSSTMAATSVASKRLFHEYKALSNDPPDGITAGPINEDDMFVWEALIQGPEGTPFEGGIFPAELRFPKDYPLAPPTMRFTCDMWHPNGEGFSFSSGRGRPGLTRGFSLSEWDGVHLHLAPAGRRPESLRACIGALEPHPERGEDLDFGHEHAGGAE